MPSAEQDGNPGQAPGGGGGARDNAGQSFKQTGGAGASGEVVLRWIDAPTTYTVLAVVGSGTVDCAPGTVASGGDSTCHAVPALGWQVSDWEGDCASAGASEYCHLTNIQEDQSSMVSFQQAAAVPVLSVWGLGLLSLLLVGAGWVRRR